MQVQVKLGALRKCKISATCRARNLSKQLALMLRFGRYVDSIQNVPNFFNTLMQTNISQNTRYFIDAKKTELAVKVANDLWL